VDQCLWADYGSGQGSKLPGGRLAEAVRVSATSMAQFRFVPE